MGALLGELGGGGKSFAKDPEDYERTAQRLGISIGGGSVGQTGLGSSTRDSEILLKRVLDVQCRSLWVFWKGTWRGGGVP